MRVLAIAEHLEVGIVRVLVAVLVRAGVLQSLGVSWCS
jgi:hypothetical protein